MKQARNRDRWLAYSILGFSGALLVSQYQNCGRVISQAETKMVTGIEKSMPPPTAESRDTSHQPQETSILFGRDEVVIHDMADSVLIEVGCVNSVDYEIFWKLIRSDGGTFQKGQSRCEGQKSKIYLRRLQDLACNRAYVLAVGFEDISENKVKVFRKCPPIKAIAIEGYGDVSPLDQCFYEQITDEEKSLLAGEPICFRICYREGIVIEKEADAMDSCFVWP